MSNNASIGHNNPPTALDEIKASSNAIIELAKSAITGDGNYTDAQIEQIEQIRDELKANRLKAIAQHKEDKRPHLEAGRKVDASYKPIIEQIKLCEAECNKPITERNLKLEEERQRIAAEKLAEAQRIEKEAQEKREEAIKSNDLEAILETNEETNKALEKAKILQATFKKLNRASTGLRTYNIANVENYGKAIASLKIEHPELLKQAINDIVQSLNNINIRNIDGVKYDKDKRAI
jgi:hypothetical protein